MDLRTARARIAPLIAASAFALPGIFTSVAGAAEAPWGSLGSFRLTSGEGKQVTLKEQESAFAVDPASGSFFIAYKPNEGNREPVRLQHFTGKGEAGPKIEFKVPSEETGANGGNLDEGVEIAYDPANSRIYVLDRWERLEQNESKTKPRPAPEGYAAGALYAFEYTGSEFVPLATEEKSKVKVPAPILGKEGFKAQGEASKEPLLHPLGLATDPTTGNVAILGEQDESSVENILKEQEKCRAAVQWVQIENTGKEAHGKLARRYVDSANVLGKHFGEPPGLASEECGGGEEASGWQAYSPTFTQGGKLLAMTTDSGEAEGTVWELPAPFAESGESPVTPKNLFAYPSTSKLALETGAEEATEATNPVLSAVPTSGSEGKLYVSAKYESGLNEPSPSALVLGYAEEAGGTKLSELGWVGGRHHFIEKAETQAEVEAASCSLPDQGGGIPLGIVVLGGYKAAGGEGVLAFKTARKTGFQELVGLNLGPGGSVAHCLQTGLEAPNVVSGAVVNPPFVSTGVTVSLESTVVAGVLSTVEWSFEYTTPLGIKGTEPPVTQLGGQLQSNLTETLLEHAFHHPGTYKVTEKIHSFGNLAGTPEVTATKSVSVHSNLKVQLAEPAAVPVKEAAAHLEAAVNVPGGTQGEQLEYAWVYGDGTSDAPAKAALNAKHEVQLTGEHVFQSRCGGRCSVKLEIRESPEGPALAETTVSVLEDEAERKEHETPPGGGGGGGGGTGGGGGSGSGGGGSPQPVPAPAPGGGVKGDQSQGNPEAKIAGSSLSVTPAGAFTVKVSCPAGESSCAGTITLKTLGAMSAAKKKSILTLASGSFTVAGGQVKAIALHLSAKARKLLARSHALKAKATVIAHDSSGASRTTSATVTLRAVKKH